MGRTLSIVQDLQLSSWHTACCGATQTCMVAAVTSSTQPCTPCGAARWHVTVWLMIRQLCQALPAGCVQQHAESNKPESELT